MRILSGGLAGGLLVWALSPLAHALPVGCQAMAGQTGAPTKFYCDVPVTRTTASGGAITVPAMLIDPGTIMGIVILFHGGNGYLGLNPATETQTTNFIVSARDQFAASKWLVVVVDPPSDRITAGNYLFGFRTTDEHAKDVRDVIGWVRDAYNTPTFAFPVWLAGTSRGSVSVANAGARLGALKVPDGLVLTSTVTAPGSTPGDTDYVPNTAVDLGKTKHPVLIVHNAEDQCFVSPFSAIYPLARQYKVGHPGPAPYSTATAAEGKVNPLAIFVYSGGDTANFQTTGNPAECEPHHFHGFYGFQADVIDDIVDWMNTH